MQRREKNSIQEHTTQTRKKHNHKHAQICTHMHTYAQTCTHMHTKHVLFIQKLTCTAMHNHAHKSIQKHKKNTQAYTSILMHT